jgi:hypothetical protein
MLSRLKLKTDPAIKKKIIELQWTGKIADYILSKLGFTMSGTTFNLPFLFVILYLVDSKNDPKNIPLVRVHENEHMHQSQSMGPFFVFWIAYIWQDIKWFYLTLNINDTYYNNKYEAQAYNIQDDVANGKLSMPDWA